MPKFALWVAVLTLSASASAQTAASLQNELLSLSQSVLDAYSSVGDLRYDTNSTQVECLAANTEVVAIAKKVREYISETESFFKSPSNEQYSYIRKASIALYSAAVSVASATNKVCSTSPEDKDIGGLYIDLASIKMDVFYLQLGKEDR